MRCVREEHFSRRRRGTIWNGDDARNHPFYFYFFFFFFQSHHFEKRHHNTTVALSTRTPRAFSQGRVKKKKIPKFGLLSMAVYSVLGGGSNRSIDRSIEPKRGLSLKGRPSFFLCRFLECLLFLRVTFEIFFSHVFKVPSLLLCLSFSSFEKSKKIFFGQVKKKNRPQRDTNQKPTQMFDRERVLYYLECRRDTPYIPHFKNIITPNAKKRKEEEKRTPLYEYGLPWNWSTTEIGRGEGGGRASAKGEHAVVRETFRDRVLRKPRKEER